MDSPEIAIAHLEERAKSNTKRIDEHDEQIKRVTKHIQNHGKDGLQNGKCRKKHFRHK